MSARRNLQLVTPYLVFSLEGVSHGFYLLWLTVHKGVSPVAAAAALAAGDVALLVLDVPTGIFADRLGARRSLILGSACQAMGLVLFWRGASMASLLAGVLAIALGDAFRHGADQALVYRSVAAIGEAGTFGRRFARAQAWALGAMVGLTAMGGWIAERIGFDVAWALDLMLSIAGLGLAWAMTEVPPCAPDPDEEEETAPLAGLRARLPWGIVVPATVTGTLGAVFELLAQTSRGEGLGPRVLAIVIAGTLALDALGAALVARGVVPIRASVLDAMGIAALAGLGMAAISPRLMVPGMLLISLCNGIALAVRDPLVQGRARDGERATAASVVGTVDMMGKAAGLPLAAWLYGRYDLAGVAAVLGAAAIVAWALSAWRSRGR